MFVPIYNTHILYDSNIKTINTAQFIHVHMTLSKNLNKSMMKSSQEQFSYNYTNCSPKYLNSESMDIVLLCFSSNLYSSQHIPRC